MRTVRRNGARADEGRTRSPGLARGNATVILGAPCNQFREQEPGTAAEIKSFCSLTYGVTFPLLAKQEVNSPHKKPAPPIWS
jgi:glutathione peroxidase-family protein